jgi:hypothetical protein
LDEAFNTEEENSFVDGFVLDDLVVDLVFDLFAVVELFDGFHDVGDEMH